VTQPTLKKRSEFLRIRGGARWSTPTVTVETRPRPAPSGADPEPDRPPPLSRGKPAAGTPPADVARFGYTVTKKLGGAVQRNRIRRRLKAAVEEIAAVHCRAGFDYVLIAKAAALTTPFGALKKDLEAAFDRVHHPRREKRRS
jgi:ribonuclease P protein component